jgi:hypothetical protein
MPEAMTNRVERQSRSWFAYVIFAVAAGLYFYPFMRTLPLLSDEGTLISGAERVMQGLIPGRDFFDVMGPGTFYWLALFFRIWGVNFLATRIDIMVTSLATAVLLYFLSRGMNLRYPILPAILFFGTAFGAFWPTISHHGDSNLFALLAFAVFLVWLERRLWFLLPLSGALAGVTTCFLQPKGVLLLGAFCASVWLLNRKEGRVFLHLTCLAAGYALILMSAAGYFWHRHALPELIYANITFPMMKYGAVNSVPYGTGLFSFYGHQWASSLSESFSPALGYPITAFLLIPFLVVAVLPALLLAAAVWGRGRAFSREAIPYWLCGFALWFSELHRKDIMHLVYGSPLLLILCCSLYEKTIGPRVRNWLNSLTVFATALALVNLLVVLTAQTKVETRRGSGYAYQSDEVLAILNANIKPGEEIFAYPFLPSYYFLLNAPNATRYSSLMQGTESQFQEVLQQLESKRVCHVIWDTTEAQSMPWSLPPGTVKAELLEDYLRTHYRTVDSRRGVLLLERSSKCR